MRAFFGALFGSVFGVVGAVAASALAVLSWVLYAIPVPSHPERLVSPIAVTACAVLLGGTVVRYELAGRRQTPAYRDHVRSLQAFSAGIRPSIETLLMRVDLSRPMGRYFRAHFPLVAAQVDDWNAIEYYQRSRRFYEAMNNEATRLGLIAQGGAVLSTVAQGFLRPEDLNWSIANDEVVVRSGQNLWVVQHTPRGTAFEDIKRTVMEYLPTLPALQIVREFRAAEQEIARQRKALVDALETIEAKADPGGHCPGCPS
jgi:hypothetical protein